MPDVATASTLKLALTCALPNARNLASLLAAARKNSMSASRSLVSALQELIELLRREITEIMTMKMMKMRMMMMMNTKMTLRKVTREDTKTTSKEERREEETKREENKREEKREDTINIKLR
jgi:hypothetical protein